MVSHTENHLRLLKNLQWRKVPHLRKGEIYVVNGKKQVNY